MVHHIIKKSAWKLGFGTTYVSFCGELNGLLFSPAEAAKLGVTSKLLCPQCLDKMKGKKK